MSIKKSALLILIFLIYRLAYAQSVSSISDISIKWQSQETGVTASLRGISAVNNKIVWASGTGGRFLKTTDGGLKWQAFTVPGADSLDFRDIEAFDENKAFLMSAGPGQKSRIYKTTNGGKSWILQFRNDYPEGFLNGMAFWDEQNGMVYGDPVDGRLFIIHTSDGGSTWQRIAPQKIPEVKAGEYGFAASGSGITVQGQKNVWICSGGTFARIFYSNDKGANWQVYNTPMIQGKQSTGIFSVAFRNPRNGIAVGGDYANPHLTNATVARTIDGGKTWSGVEGAKSVAFRSCISYIPGSNPQIVVAVGSSGSDYSTDDGLTWVRIDTTGFHTMSFANSKDAGWAAGADGRIAKLILE